LETPFIQWFHAEISVVNANQAAAMNGTILISAPSSNIVAEHFFLC